METIGGTTCPCCKEEGTLMCTGCKSIKYCSVECQQCDFPSHRFLCKTFKDFQERPSPDMRRIIMFDPDENKPTFMWRPVYQGDGFQTVGCKELMRGAVPHSNEVLKHAFTEKALSYMMRVHYDDDFKMKYKELNKSIMSATNGRAGQISRGPVFVEAGYPYYKSLDIAEVKDMDMRTYADVIPYLIDYGVEMPKKAERKGPKVTAVKANCKGEQRLRGVPAFVNVKIPASHPMFDDPRGDSPVSKRIGMPVCTLRYGSVKEFTETSGDVVNQPITFMHRSVDGDARYEKNGTPPFGFAPPCWSRDVGNVLIARKDRKTLSLETVEAFAAYCRYHLGACNDWQYERVREFGGETFKITMLQQITPARWTSFLEQWSSQKGREFTPDEDNTKLNEEELVNRIARMAFNQQEKGQMTKYLLMLDAPTLPKMALKECDRCDATST